MEITLGQQYIMSGRSPPLYCTLTSIAMQGHQKNSKNKTDNVGHHHTHMLFKKNLIAPRPSEHPPKFSFSENVVVKRKIRTRLNLLSIPQSGGESVKTFRWDHRLQIKNLLMAFKWVPRWK